MSRLRKAVKRFSNRKQTALRSFPAVMGNGAGVVESGRDGYVWVRFGKKTKEVFNDSIAPQNNLPISVGYTSDRPNLMRVLGVRTIGNVDVTGKQAQNKPVHHAGTHRYGDLENGNDILWVELRQIMPLRLSIGEDMQVGVTRGILHDASGTWSWENNTLIDLDGTQPETSGSYRWMLFSFTDDRELVVTTGSIYAGTASLDTLPESPSNTIMDVGAVRLYGEQYEIREGKRATDIIDLRFPSYHRHSEYASCPYIECDDDDGPLVTINASLSVTEKRYKSFETSTGTYTVGDVEVHICNSASDYTLTLPEHEAGREIRIINRSTGVVTLTPPTGTFIKGEITEELNEWESLILISDGSDWL